MAASDFVQVTVSVSGSANPSRQGFGTPLVAAYHTHWTDRVHVYPAAAALATMVTEGFATTEAAYKAIAKIVSQDPCPAQVAVGRRALKMSQTLTITYTDATAGDTVAFTIVGSDGTPHVVSITTSGTPATDAAAAVAIITAISGHATIFGTVSATGAVITCSRTDGLLTDLQAWAASLTIADTTTDPGIATDLAAIRAANNAAWYGLALDSNSAAEIEAAAAWAEATGVGGKFLAWNNSDSTCVTSSTSDVFSTLKGLSYQRDIGFYSGKQLLSYTGAAMLGELLPFNPGQAAWGYKTPVGVTPDDDVSLTETEALILNTMSVSNPGPGGKRGNYFKVTSDEGFTFPGCTPGGEWADITIFVDWLQTNMQADVLALLLNAPKLPFTDFGIGLIANAIRNRIKIGASSAFGGIDGSQPITVNVPTASTVDATDRGNRNLPNVTFGAALTGAILTVGIQGNLTE